MTICCLASVKKSYFVGCQLLPLFDNVCKTLKWTVYQCLFYFSEQPDVGQNGWEVVLLYHIIIIFSDCIHWTKNKFLFKNTFKSIQGLHDALFI